MDMHSNHASKGHCPRGAAVKRQDGTITYKEEQRPPQQQNNNGKEHSSHRPRESNGSAVSFSTNNNSVVCLPLVSEGLKLVWTQSDQTRELDSIPALVQAFNIFPYPTSQEVSTLAQICALPLDKVKVWFMVQRIKYGISWASEDIEETRDKLGRPVQATNTEQTETRGKRKNCTEDVKEEVHQGEDLLESPQLSRKRHKTDNTEPAMLSPAPSRFRSSLPPPQDSYYYRHPVEIPETSKAASPPSSSESPIVSDQPRNRRYKKSKAQLAALRKSFLKENWPDEKEVQRLQEETGLNRNEIRKWFSDGRYQLRIGKGLSMSVPITEGERDAVDCTLTSPQPSEVQPLSLTAKKQTPPHNISKGKEKNPVKGSQRNRPKNSEFFQLFLSNTLEAFEGASKGDEEKDESKIENNDELADEKDGFCPPPTELAPSSITSPSITLSKDHLDKSSTSTRKSKSMKKKEPPLDDTLLSAVPTPAGRQRKTKEQLAILKEFFQRCPWPKGDEYTEIVEQTSLPRADIIQWFGDTRYAVKNGHVRWVHPDIRDQVLAEIALLQSGTADASGTPGSEVIRKRKSTGNSATKTPKLATDSVDTSPLEVYYTQTGSLQEKDLDHLCKKSKMSYLQVRDWFAYKDSVTPDTDLNVID
ncbi:hypothetical protein DNTS_028536 [Danionella cerebrum]|uniref:Homeobox domain-containing protein n=1 Tax=Danionella cerebrum TaxID=2873325 RepID=A0A553MSP5_9TELE|nr:hypothetical protein DNTS_028536 [Danionella translucida]